jgi:hypothetical protein
MGKAAEGGIKGMPVNAQVTVGPPPKVTPEERLLIRVRGMMMGRRIEDVALRDEQLVFWLDDGGTLSLACPGGFKEVN